ncbi:copper amine oxidase N-terminal domain-containing protein [Brevibacillus fulvus]|uniref:Copper amine oxidase-like N-terminal domain-containing protein n=1 Tax=Brevibacillus fulvus TaxID=1125967 RepID=A0A939BTI1_9BACL|nr:copper amine oxidase N-terminal domain-containing protein [Brevibacillus fulvus]MBM7591528.1 hypothetical protein [Brevibacillus fulvus]
MKISPTMRWLAAVTVSAAVGLGAVYSPPAAWAASGNKQVVQQIKSTYDAFKEKEKAEYQTLKDQAGADYQQLKELAQADYTQLKKLAEQDYATLKKQYSSKQLDAYYGQINRLGQAVDRYYGQINRLGQSLDAYYGEVFRLGNALDRYYGQVYRLGGLLDRYYGQVYRLGGKLNQYERTGGSASAIRQEFAQLHAEISGNLEQFKQETRAQLLKRRAATIQTVCATKQQTIAALNQTRKKLVGQAKSYGSFEIDSVCQPAIKFVVNGVEQKLNPASAPVADDFLVPVFPVLDLLGANYAIASDGQTIRIAKGSANLQLTANSAAATINGAAKQILAPPRWKGDTYLIPIRLVGQALGASVTWQDATKTITIVTGKP